MSYLHSKTNKKIYVTLIFSILLAGCQTTSWTRYYYDKEGIEIKKNVLGKTEVSLSEKPIMVIVSNSNDEAKLSIKADGAIEASKNSKSEPFINKVSETVVALTTVKMMDG